MGRLNATCSIWCAGYLFNRQSTNYFFKVVYRRHTNFSMESIEQTLSGDSDYGGSATATISRNGDLVYRMWIEHMEDMSQHDGQLIIDNLGAGIVERVELEIGGQIIDAHLHDHSLALLLSG